MKNILLATTALVATAGVASADIGLTGSAEMGLIGGEHIDTQFHTDIDVTFTMSGEADNGLTFGASIDLDESDGTNGKCSISDDDDISCDIKGSSDAFGITTQGGETIFIAYGPTKLTMGDTDGAYDAAMQEAIIGSAINDDHEHGAFNGNGGLDGAYDGQIATLSYGASGFNGYLSVEISDGGDVSPIWGIGGNYSAESGGVSWTIGVGYQTGDKDSAVAAASGVDLTDINSLSDLVGAVSAAGRTDVTGISLGATFAGGFEGIFNYSQANYADFGEATIDGRTITTGETESHWGLALGYSMNAMTLGANYGEYQNFLGVDGAKVTGWGLAADYDLGGGLEAQLGYGSTDGEENDFSTWSIGLAMTF